MSGKLSVIGIQGHVAYPNRANNPSTALVQILKELKEIKFDKGTKDFQPTNLEITKINIVKKYLFMSFVSKLIFVNNNLFVKIFFGRLNDKIWLIEYFFKRYDDEILKEEKPFLIPLNVLVFISKYKRNTPKRITKK